MLQELQALFLMKMSSLNWLSLDQVLRVAGQGTFGTVFECLDRKYEEIVAVKAVRSIRRYLEAAEVEIDILDRIRQEDREKNS